MSSSPDIDADMDIVGSDSDLDVVMIDDDDVSNFNPEQILPQSPEDIQKIRNWLEPTAYDIVGGEYRKHQKSHVKGTGTWLSSSKTYQEWLHGTQHGLLWIKGIPGSGKSVVAANLIDELKNSQSGCPVLYFFFRQIIDANHEPQALLRDWMDQVLNYSPPLQMKLLEYVKTRRSLDSLAMEDLWKDLRMAFAGLPGKVFCVADALDEMDGGNDTFLQALGALGQWRPGKTKVLITSRPVPKVEAPLRKVPCLHIRLQENFVDVDISTFVHHALSKSTIPAGDQKAITDAVPGRANGLFLYAKLAMDAFLEPGANVPEVLSQLPADLNVLYTELLKEHAQRSGVAADLQHLILQSVTHATRPLRLLELADMIKTLHPRESTKDVKAAKDLIRAACGPLLEILADDTVSVIHHSFTEYLKGNTRHEDGTGYPILHAGPTHALLADACLRYLGAGCLDDIEVTIRDDRVRPRDMDLDFGMPSKSGGDEEVRHKLTYPFFEYASSSWSHHVTRSESAGHNQRDMSKMIGDFLDNDRNMKVWLQFKWPGGSEEATKITRLHVAAEEGLLSYAQELLKSSEVVVDALDIAGKTPLWWAASRGHAKAVSALIAAGANPDREDDEKGLKPLHEAASKNHFEVVGVLLQAGVNPLTGKTRENPGRRCGNAPRSTGHTPLMYACHNGHVEAVGAFLPFLDANAVQGALAWAAERGQSKAVARILQHPGVNPNGTSRGDAPLFLACKKPDLETVRVLLKAGADPNVDCEDQVDEFAGMGGRGARVWIPGKTYELTKVNCMNKLCERRRHYSSQPGYERELQAVFELLLEAGADIHRRNLLGETCLHTALNSPVLVRLLIQAGADANARDERGNTPLRGTAAVECIKVLVEEGHADINALDEKGQTPLFSLLSHYAVDCTEAFLEYGPDCNIIDLNGNGVLHMAANQWNTNSTLVKILLEKGADPNLVNGKGNTPLLELKVGDRDCLELLDLLLDAGADLEAKDEQGFTLLMRLISSLDHDSRGHATKTFKALLQRGASVSVKDSKGRTMLHEAVKSFSTYRATQNSRSAGKSAVDVLLDVVPDANVVDNDGNGLLHEMAMHEDNHGSYHEATMVSFWKRLVALGLDMNQKNNAGQTPLHIMSSVSTPYGLGSRDEPMPIDCVILKTEDLDAADEEGVTALHMSISAGFQYARRLLDAGANPLPETKEGITPLHLAALCRQPNTVGLLLDAIRKRHPTSTGFGPVEGVNAQASSSACFGTPIPSPFATPLYYAVRSGRPETVALLLEAGADVDLTVLFQACVSFDREGELWRQRQRNARTRRVVVMGNDEFRPCDSTGSYPLLSRSLEDGETTRLEEILRMLVGHGLGNTMPNVAADEATAAIDAATRQQSHYVVRCLSAIRDSLTGQTSSKVGDDETSADPVKSADLYREESAWSRRHLEQILKDRQYQLVETMFHEGFDFLALDDEKLECGLIPLIQGGFASLLAHIGALEAQRYLDRASGAWHAFGDPARPGLWYADKDRDGSEGDKVRPTPLLLEALRRDLPNMEVVKVLVEQLGVHVDELASVNEYDDRLGVSVTALADSALHEVSHGKTWWHVRQALPYLIEKGADVNLRMHRDVTPLLSALRFFESGPFQKEAIGTLIEAGADVNAVDDEGKSCLAHAVPNVQLVDMLVASGATVTADAIFAAISARSVAAVRVLLGSPGADANMRRRETTSDVDTMMSDEQMAAARLAQRDWRRRGGSTTIDFEFFENYPLFEAASLLAIPWQTSEKSTADLATAGEMVQLLLDHGADPLAKFLRGPFLADDPNLAFVARDEPSIAVPPGRRECTVMHELLMGDIEPDVLLAIPGLDVEARDARGRTLLLAAADWDLDEGTHGQGDYTPRWNGDADEGGEEGRSVMRHLTEDLGADIEARDHCGRNVLHCMLGGEAGSSFPDLEESVAYVLAREPGLIDQAAARGDGRTPLLQAAWHAGVKPYGGDGALGAVELLLSKGADPLVRDGEGNTILHYLARDVSSLKRQEMFRGLVTGRGVDINARNARGETCLFDMVRRKKIDRRLEGDTSYSQNVLQAVRREVEFFARARDELGADFGARDETGRGLLHVAAGGNVDVFRELVEGMGLDSGAEDGEGRTAVDYAAAQGNLEVLDMFTGKD